MDLENMKGYDDVIIPQDKLQQRNADRRAAKARAGNRADDDRYETHTSMGQRV